MMRFELGLEEPDPKRARNSALTIAVSYIAGGMVPLAPYFFMNSVHSALIGSVAVIRTLIDAIAPRNIDVLMIEGTHLGQEREQNPTEFEVEEQVLRLVEGAKRRLVLSAFSPQDVDRLVTMYRVARRTGRTFVADAYAAFVL